MYNTELKLVRLSARPKGWLPIVMWLSGPVVSALLGLALGAALAHLGML